MSRKRQSESVRRAGRSLVAAVMLFFFSAFLLLALRDNAWQYGFIQRYPEGKTAATGVAYTPFHYRYVGREAAQQLWELGLTLEEYIDLFYPE